MYPGKRLKINHCKKTIIFLSFLGGPFFSFLLYVFLRFAFLSSSSIFSSTLSLPPSYSHLSLCFFLFFSLFASLLLLENTFSRGKLTHYLPYYLLHFINCNSPSFCLLLLLSCSSFLLSFPFHHFLPSFFPSHCIHSPLHSLLHSLLSTLLSLDSTTTPSYIKVGSCHK